MPPTAPASTPLPQSPTLSSSSSSSLSAFSTATQDTDLHPVHSLHDLVTQNTLLLSRIISHDRAEQQRLRALTAELKAHNDAIDERRRKSAQLAQ
ncbi:MAG: hypothetical protein Q9225_006676, partial [Loekoesia sp. 1 TL-2023]